MKNLELWDGKAAALIRELDQLINRAKYPFSERVRTLGGKLRPERPREPPEQRKGLRPAVER